jgi:hypothetical protein
VELNSGLQEWEVEDAWSIVRWLKGNGPFFGIAGIMLVSGPPRQGKGLFSNTLAWKIKRYFKGKHILRDDHPTDIFGKYTLLNEDTVMADVARMSVAAEGDVPKEARKAKDKARLAVAVREWQQQQGEILFQNSVVLKDEFWKDMNKRRPMNPMNLLFGGLIKMWGHLDMLLIGIIQNYRDLDRFTCLPFVQMHVKCTWCSSIPDTTEVNLYHVQWSDARQKLIPTEKRPVRILLNGGRPRPELDGDNYFSLFKSKSSPSLQSLAARGR